MTAYFLEMFGVSLGLTLLLELPVGFCMGMRKGKYLALMVLVNILTNPAAVMICWLGGVEPLVELVVVIVEAAIYKWFSNDDRWNIAHPLLLSAAANGFSWITGVFLQSGGFL